VITWAELTTVGLGRDLSVPNEDCAHTRAGPIRVLIAALPGDLDSPAHEPHLV
jgi:hypothetical protein